MDRCEVGRQRFMRGISFYGINELAAAATQYQAAWQILPELGHRRLLPAEIMGRTYYEILLEIRARNYNVFTRRASLRRRDKLRVAALALARAGMARL